MQRPALTFQQETIKDVRTRYERGLLAFEQFANALIQMQIPEECRAIVQRSLCPAKRYVMFAPGNSPAWC